MRLIHAVSLVRVQVPPPITKEIPLGIYFIIHDAWTRTIGSHVVGAERKKKVYFLFSEATPNIISLQSKEIAKYPHHSKLKGPAGFFVCYNWILGRERSSPSAGDEHKSKIYFRFIETTPAGLLAHGKQNPSTPTMFTRHLGVWMT